MKYLICFLFFQTIALAQVKSIFADVEKTMQSIPESQKKHQKILLILYKVNFLLKKLKLKPLIIM